MGTPESMYDEQGEEIWSCQLNSYGKVRNFQGAYKTDCPFRFQGQYEDGETGLYYNRFRYYSPEEGVYLSQDPIGLTGNNPTLYGYVQDTNNLIDVFGLDCKVGQEIAPNSKVRRIKNGTNGETIIIGRNMDDRVIPSAKNIGAEWWTGFDDSLPTNVNLVNNQKWLNKKLTEGYTVIDIGLDPKWVSRGSKAKGPFYRMETQTVFGVKW